MAHMGFIVPSMQTHSQHLVVNTRIQLYVSNYYDTGVTSNLSIHYRKGVGLALTQLRLNLLENVISLMTQVLTYTAVCVLCIIFIEYVLI